MPQTRNRNANAFRQTVLYQEPRLPEHCAQRMISSFPYHNAVATFLSGPTFALASGPVLICGPRTFSAPYLQRKTEACPNVHSHSVLTAGQGALLQSKENNNHDGDSKNKQ
eukprot:291761-Amphidinium_carterae.1